MGRARAPLVWGLVAALCAPCAALAETRVELRTAGSVDAAAALEPVLRELLGRLGVSLEATAVDRIDLPVIMTPVPTAPPAVARVWIDLGAPDAAVVHVVDGSWTRLLIRRVPVVDVLDEIEREEIGHILEAAVEALLAGEVVGEPWQAGPAAAPPVSPPPAAKAPAPRAPRPTPPATPRPWRLDLGARYEAQGFATGDLLHGPGVHATLRLGRERLHVTATLSTSIVLPLTLRTPELSIDLVGADVRLVAGLGIDLGRSLRLLVGLGPGLDLVHDTPHTRDARSVSAESPRWTALAMGRTTAALALSLTRRLGVWVAAGVDLDATDLRFTVRSATGARAALDPPRARPTVLLGLDLLDP